MICEYKDICKTLQYFQEALMRCPIPKHGDEYLIAILKLNRNGFPEEFFFQLLVKQVS